jgi:hypothetical protein
LTWGGAGGVQCRGVEGWGTVGVGGGDGVKENGEGKWSMGMGGSVEMGEGMGGGEHGDGGGKHGDGGGEHGDGGGEHGDGVHGEGEHGGGGGEHGEGVHGGGGGGWADLC